MRGFDLAIVVFGEGGEEALAVFFFLHQIAARVGADFVAQEALQKFDCEVLQRGGADVFEEFVGDEADVWLVQTGEVLKTSLTPSEITALSRICLRAGILFFLGTFAVDAAGFEKDGFYRGEEGDFFSEGGGFVESAAEGIGFATEAITSRKRFFPSGTFSMSRRWLAAMGNNFSASVRRRCSRSLASLHGRRLIFRAGF